MKNEPWKSEKASETFFHICVRNQPWLVADTLLTANCGFSRVRKQPRLVADNEVLHIYVSATSRRCLRTKTCSSSLSATSRGCLWTRTSPAYVSATSRGRLRTQICVTEMSATSHGWLRTRKTHSLLSKVCPQPATAGCGHTFAAEKKVHVSWPRRMAK